MKFGVAMFPAHYAVRPSELGQLVERYGFESLFLPEHTHIPASRRTPYPAGGELPREYSHTHDPFVALATVAEATERLLVATGICLVVERDPIVTAKEVASLDHLSDGRFLFGVGAGWNREEMENHGTDPHRRFSLMRERIEAMKAIWTQDEATYHGEHVSFDAIWSWPKPVQDPHPPILVGGNGPKVIDRVVAFGDEWMPTIGRSHLEHIARQMAELQEKAAAAGRDEIPVTASAAPRDPEVLERFRDTGFHRAVSYIRPGPRDEVERQLEKLARLVGELQAA